jgi:hypothetical protein
MTATGCCDRRKQDVRKQMKLDIPTPDSGSLRHIYRHTDLRSRPRRREFRPAFFSLEPELPSDATRSPVAGSIPIRPRRSRRRLAIEICGWLLAAAGILLVDGCGTSLVGPLTAGASSSLATGNIYVAWQPHPDPTVTGYVIYYGPSVTEATTIASNQPVNSPNFDPQAPSVSYDAAANLGLHTGDTVCFRLRAYNPDGESDFTAGTCTTV